MSNYLKTIRNNNLDLVVTTRNLLVVENNARTLQTRYPFLTFQDAKIIIMSK